MYIQVWLQVTSGSLCKINVWEWATIQVNAWTGGLYIASLINGDRSVNELRGSDLLERFSSSVHKANIIEQIDSSIYSKPLLHQSLCLTGGGSIEVSPLHYCHHPYTQRERNVASHFYHLYLSQNLRCISLNTYTWRNII